MNSTLLLDTHILVHWMAEDRRLTKEQLRQLRAADVRGLPFAVSSITLVELGQLIYAGKLSARFNYEKALDDLANEHRFEIVQIDTLIAREFHRLLPVLRDPMDSMIVATAQVHNLRLVTSDARIIDSRLVPVVF